jgi:hypothetical protein
MKLAARSDESLLALAHQVRQEQLRRRGSTHVCTVCATEFVARAGARTCSTTCRVRAQRSRVNASQKEHRVIGIGYEGLSLDRLVARLKLNGVETLVDVRLTPLSRKPGLSKRALSEALSDAGIHYIHDRRLGNPKDNRAAYADASSDAGAAARASYRALITSGDGADAVRELAALAEKQSVAVLCFEADETRCHREQVIIAVADASILI